MKKAILLLLVIGMVGILAACGSSTGVSPEAGQNLAHQKRIMIIPPGFERDLVGMRSLPFCGRNG